MGSTISMQSLKNNNIQLIHEKDKLLRELITKIVDDKIIEPSANKFLKDKNFMDTYYIIASDVSKKFNEKKQPSMEYLEQSYKFIPANTKKSQYDISELLRQIYVKEYFNAELINYQQSISLGQMDGYKDFVQKMSKVVLKFEPIKIIKSDDENTIMSHLDELGDNSGIIKLGMEGFDDLEKMRGHLVAYLAGTGSGKSYTLQKLTAQAFKHGYKNLHFSLELRSALFWRRFFVQLGLIKDEEFQGKTAKGLPRFSLARKKRLMKDFKAMGKSTGGKLFLSTLDSEGGDVDVSKIEKAIQEFEPDIVEIDHVQHLDENWNPMESDVAQRLSKLAIIYNCLIIIAVQTNDEGSNSEKPPEFKHIEKCKNIKNPCDKFIAQKGTRMPMKGWMRMEYISRKDRMGNIQHFVYQVDTNTGEWILMDNTQMIGEPEKEEVINQKGLNSMAIGDS